jgi:hypothetical protein
MSAIQRKRWRGLEQEEFIEQVRNFRDEHSEFYVYIKSSFGGGWQLLYDDMHRVDEALRYYDGAVMSYSGHDVKLIKAPKGERHLYIIYEQKIRAANCTDG